MTRPRVLVVDDTEDVRVLVQAVLNARGFDVTTLHNGQAMDDVLRSQTPDLILLDANMPGESGFSICQRLAHDGGPPVIMLTSMSQQRDKNNGLAGGAADYVTKPFDADELALRIRAVLRRSPSRLPPDVVSFSGWRLETTSRTLTSPADRSLILTNAEFALLCVFLKRPDRPIRHTQILEQMQTIHGFSTEHALKTLVSRLRIKLEYLEPGSELIQTIYGIGYLLKPGLMNS
jgi:two-component system, OmpR family, response regulator